jgi:hypothetical protein
MFSCHKIIMTQELYQNFLKTIKFIDAFKLFDLQTTFIKIIWCVKHKVRSQQLSFLGLPYWCDGAALLCLFLDSFTDTAASSTPTLILSSLAIHISLVQERSSLLRTDHWQTDDIKEGSCMGFHYILCTFFYHDIHAFFHSLSLI